MKRTGAKQLTTKYYKIANTLFIGNQWDAKRYHEAFDKIYCVADDIDSQVISVFPRFGHKLIHTPLVDRHGNDEAVYKNLILQVSRDFLDKKYTLVFCRGGRSRSASVISGALVHSNHLSDLYTAEAYLQEISPEVNIHPGLKRSLLQIFPPFVKS